MQGFDWDELLALIKAREVVPVVGRGLLTAETTDGRRLFHRLPADTEKPCPPIFALDDIPGLAGFIRS